MLDVHILISRDTPEEWVKQCLESVYSSAESAPFKVNVFPTKGIDGHIGKGRKLGYSKGNALYKTYVDDDDYLLPDAFSCLHPAMLKSFAGIFTGEMLLQNGKFKKSTGRHHLAVYRNDVISDFDFDSYIVNGDIATRFLAEHHPDGTVGIPHAPYVHRVYKNSKARQLRRNHQEEYEKAISYG